MLYLSQVQYFRGGPALRSSLLPPAPAPSHHHCHDQALPHGHLMNYPIHVTEEGQQLWPVEDFLDLGGKVSGTKSTVLPSTLTG